MKKMMPKEKPSYLQDQILTPEQMREEMENPSMQGPSKPYQDEDWRMEEVENFNQGGMCRGSGKAVTGKGFKGVF
jgi:hypothetical protein